MRDSPTDHEKVFGRFHDAVNTRDPQLIAKTIDEIVDPDLIFHVPAPVDATGAQLFKLVWAALLRAFPDLEVTTEDVIAEGDKVVYRNTVTGTHLGEYRGLAPTGKSITYNEIFIIRFAGGRIAEIWGVVDVYGQMQQLGVLPSVH
jgi:predicted ester cyclase